MVWCSLPNVYWLDSILPLSVWQMLFVTSNSITFYHTYSMEYATCEAANTEEVSISISASDSYPEHQAYNQIICQPRRT